MTVKKNGPTHQIKSLLLIFWLLVKNFFIRVLQFFSLLKVIVLSLFTRKVDYKRSKLKEHLSKFNHHPKFYLPAAEEGFWGGKLSNVQYSATALAKLGSRYSKMILIHGTFVGSDPLALKIFLEKFFDTGFGAELALSRLLKMVENTFKLSGDLGNFTCDYARSCESYLKIPTEIFQWSSSNHHTARVLGAIDLLLQLQKSEGRVILVGHSHGGQLLAVFSHFLNLNSSPIKKELILFLEKAEQPVDEILKIVSGLNKQLRVDFVTLGCPVRYSWTLHKKSRLLHIVNARNPMSPYHPLDGILQTKHGDYIQLLGVAGSDFLATSNKHRILNQHCDTFLGSGSNLVEWRANLSKNSRISQFGKTLLVDFEDASMSRRPNFLKTLCGHGFYTKTHNVAKLLKLIQDVL